MRKLLTIVLLVISFTSCKDQELRGSNSLKGDWIVTSINSYYGEFTENGFSGIENIKETGNLGFFDFQDGIVDFNFTRNDTIYSGNSQWNLDARKVSSGFTRVTEFKLEIVNEFDFKCQFGDATKNSEKNATQIMLSQSPETVGFGVAITLTLEKN